MPIHLWRIGIDTRDYVSDDMSGWGAELTGGRWNWPGTAIVYAATSRSLACLESLVHLARRRRLPLNRYLVQITVPDDLWAARAVCDHGAHVGWDGEPIGLVSLQWGARWESDGASVLAEVPSVIVPEESNVLINPRHPDVARIASAKVRRWTYDARLATSRDRGGVHA